MWGLERENRLCCIIKATVFKVGMELPLSGLPIYLEAKGSFSALQAVVSGMAQWYLLYWS